MAFLNRFDDKELTARARKKNPRYKRWVGAIGTASRRTYVCRICDEEIDSESANYPPTRHAERAIEDHLDLHRNG